MTKILTRQCSIPDINGDDKDGKCYLNVIYAVQMDIDLYNYVDVVLRKVRMGILKDEQTTKVINSAKDSEDNDNSEIF